MTSPHLAFAKIVATPTKTAWSQAYNAGGLFTILSLSIDEDSEEDLAVLGKKLISTLEAEFFTLEEKNLESIKNALTPLLDDVPQEVNFSLVVSYIKDAFCYCFVTGEGKIIIKRNDKVGTLLQSHTKTRSLTNCSGRLHPNDCLLISTTQFTSLVTQEKIAEALSLSLPNDMAETLTPLVHGTDEGGASAIFLRFHGIPREDEVLPERYANESEKREEDTDEEIVGGPQTYTKQSIRLPRINTHIFQKLSIFPSLLPVKRLLILGVCILLAVALGVGIYTTKRTESDANIKALFTQVYEPAEKAYKDGSELSSLNKALARDDFLKAQKILEDNKEKFPKDSEERKKIDTLLESVNAQLGSSSNVRPVAAKEIEKKESPLLAAYLEDNDVKAVTQDDPFVYMITEEAIHSIDKGNQKDSAIIDNDDTWETPRSVATYLGNFYVLDAKTVTKFTPTSNDFAASSYFKDSAPNLSKAASLAVDGSIWILFTDGTIAKYTKGEKDSFKVSNLDTPLKNPKKIATNTDIEKLYILDTGNSRIVILQKDGSFEAQLASSVIKDATDFEVNEKEKVIYLLSGKKLYSLPL